MPDAPRPAGRRPTVSHVDRARAAALAALAALAAAGPASAQRGAGDAPDLAGLAHEWARGQFGSPLLCELPEGPARGFRRVLIAPGPRHAQPAGNLLRLFDLDAAGASRCFDALGGVQPNVVGSLLLSLRGRSRPDTAQRDFQAALRRDGGFDYRIAEGRLRLEPVGAPPPAPRVVDFAGGLARLHAIKRGSDAERLLREYPSPRKLLLALEAPDGTRLELPLVQYGER